MRTRPVYTTVAVTAAVTTMGRRGLLGLKATHLVGTESPCRLDECDGFDATIVAAAGLRTLRRKKRFDRYHTNTGVDCELPRWCKAVFDVPLGFCTGRETTDSS